MRARDVHAIWFCVISMLVLLVGSLLLAHNLIISLALTAAYGVLVLTRPRMVRVMRRLKGEPDWSGYFDNEGTRLKPRSGPGTAPGSPRPIERP